MAIFLHQRLTRSLLEEMASGIYREGQRFFSLRKIERLWGVSEPTIVRCLDALVGKGLLQKKMRSGYFLAPHYQPKAQLLLRRYKVAGLPFPLSYEQRLRAERGEAGGDVAVLLEAFAPLVCTEHSEFPRGGGITPTIRRCADGFAKQGAKYGFHPRWLFYDHTAASAAWAEKQLLAGEYRAAIVYCRSGNPLIPDILEPFLKGRKPAIMLYADCQNLAVHSIDINNVAIGFDAIQDLYRKGHRNIAVLTRPSPPKTHIERLHGVRLAASDPTHKGIHIEIIEPAHIHPSSSKFAATLSDPEKRPTALFLLDSKTLSSILPIIKKQKLRIPDDISIILCSSRRSFPDAKQEMNTMHLDVGRRIGRLAADTLYRILLGKRVVRYKLIDIQAISRGSTRTILQSEIVEPTKTIVK